MKNYLYYFLGGSLCYSYSIIYIENPTLSMKAPTLWFWHIGFWDFGGFGGFRETAGVGLEFRALGFRGLGFRVQGLGI